MVDRSINSFLGGDSLHTLDELRSFWLERRFPEAWTVYCALEAMGTESEGHLVGAHVAWALDELFEARYACERAFKFTPSGDILGNLRFRYATVLLRLGQPEMAVAQFRDWLDSQNEYPALVPVMLGPVWNNLGLSYWRAGRKENALTAFTAACDAFRAEGILSSLCGALQNLAWIGCAYGDEIQGRTALEEARPLCTTDYLRWHQRIGEAYLEFVAGEPRLVLEICNEIRQHPGDEIPLEVRSHACWVAGSVELELGQLETAERLALEGLHLGKKVKEQEGRCLYDNADLLRAVEDRRNAIISERNSPGP